MKYFALLILALTLISSIASAQEATLAWFTDAITTTQSFPKVTKPDNAQPDVTGSYKNGVLLTHSVGFTVNTLNRQNGMINFWIKPNWNGNDNQRHIFLKIGDPSSNGILIEKSAQNTLRFVMAGGSPVKVASSRIDVSNWEAGKWHHIACSWVTTNNKPLGLGLWVDRVCVDSVVFGGSAFMTPPSDKTVYIGDVSSDAIMDELIIRNNVTGSYGPSQIAMVYRDYFRTAPYTAIKIDPNANQLPSDPRVVLNAQKQFGLQALRQEGYWERVTNFDVRYGQWSDFDAKPFITWYSNKTSVATVDNTASSARRGLVTGKAVGNATLTAYFRGMTANYNLNVISWDQPDLNLMYVERYPRYSYDGSQKWVYGGSFTNTEQAYGRKWPSEGETCTSVVHYGNYGFRPSPDSKIRFELVSDNNENFVLDDEDTVKYSTEVDVASLEPNTRATKTFTWTWPRKSQGEHPVFVRVTIDPDNTVDEICEANNQRCELNIAQAFLWRYDQQLFTDTYNARQINYTGSFSYFDWANGQIDRLSQLLRDTVLPTTSPIGIHDAIRVDDYFPQTCEIWDYEPNITQRERFYDDWFASIEPWQRESPLDFDPAIDHEITHGLETPDLYGHPHIIYNVFLKDPDGKAYAGTQLYPALNEWGTGILPLPQYDQTDMLGFGYDTMMVSCHWWLDRYIAGMIHRTAGERDKRYRGCDAVTDCPAINKLLVLDINDQPLKNAAIYAYQLTEPIFNQGDIAGSKYVPDRPKFMGNVDANGYWTFPNVTDPTWDDLETNIVEGSMSIRNPFHVVNREFEPPWWAFGGYFILKIVGANGQVEFRTFSQIELWDAYMSGYTDTAIYPIKTNLTASESPVEIVPPVIPDAIKQQNLKPVAIAPTNIYVTPGQIYTIDGSASYDPEGQPLIYRWIGFGDNYGIYPPFSTSATRLCVAPQELGDYTYHLYVLDGLRYSDPLEIRVRVTQPDSTPPIMGVVYDDGDTTYDNTSLYASWYAIEPDSGIAEYQYAIGTSPTDPGSGYTVGWTSTGTASSVTVTGLNLVIGQTYYFYVKAKNVSNLWSDVAVSDGIKVLAPITIAEAKHLPAGTNVMLLNAVCTGYTGTYRLYIQSLDRSAGVAVNYYGSETFTPGMIVKVKGTIYSMYEGEPVIDSTTITVMGNTTVTPLGLTNRAIGGVKTGLQEGTISWKWVRKQDGTSEYKLLPDSGLNNTGLFIKTTGKVTYIDPAGMFMYINDGSHVDDGNTLGPDRTSVKGIQVSLKRDYTAFYKAPQVGSYISVTGISSIRYDIGYKSTIKLRSQDDIAATSGAIITGRICAPSITNYPAETPHPCSPGYYNSWNITGPAGTVKMRLHFTKIDNKDSYIYYYSPSNGGYAVYPPNTNTGIWTEWVPGDNMIIGFYNYGSSNPYGFQMDMYESLVPLANVAVTLMPGNITTTTDANGCFFFADVEPGSYTITPSMSGTLFNPSSQEVTVNQGQIQLGVDFATN